MTFKYRGVWTCERCGKTKELDVDKANEFPPAPNLWTSLTWTSSRWSGDIRLRQICTTCGDDFNNWWTAPTNEPTTK